MDQCQSQDLNQNFFRFLTFKSNILSSIITNKTVKPFIKAHDFYPGFALEEECFSNAIIKDVDSKSKKKDQESMTWPREKSVKQSGYEQFILDAINEKTGEFWPQKDQDNRAIKNTGALYYYTDIYRIRRQDGSEFLYTKGKVYAQNSLGDSIDHFISKPEIYTKTLFSYKTEYNDKTKQMEKVLQGPSGSEEIYTLPFNKENLKQLYDNRQNDLLGLAVKDELTGKAFQVKDVTGNISKSYELLRDQSFSYLFGAEYIPKEIKAELRQEAVAQGIIHGGAGDYQPPPSGATTPKNTYQ